MTEGEVSPMSPREAARAIGRAAKSLEKGAENLGKVQDAAVKKAVGKRGLLEKSQQQAAVADKFAKQAGARLDALERMSPAERKGFIAREQAQVGQRKKGSST